MALTTAYSTRANLADAYKELFPQIRVDQLANMERDFLKWVPKKDDLEGDGIHIPLRYAMPQGLGATYAGAQDSVTSGKVDKFFITRQKYYAFVTIDAEAMRSARSRTGAFYDVKETEIEDMVQNVSKELEIHLWRDGSGALGTIASVADGTNVVTITLADPEDVANFQVGMYLSFYDDSGSAMISKNTADDGRVTAVDVDAGTITITAADAGNLNGTALAVDDIIYRGSRSTGATTDKDGVVTGVAGWIPITAESAGTFFTMDRTDDVVRKQGFRQTYQGSVEETVKKLLTKMSRYGASPQSIWVSHENWHRLELELGSRAVREDGTAGTFGLPSLKYASPKGVMLVMPGTFCPNDRGYLLKREDWTLHHLDPVPHLIMDDGLRAVRGRDYDGIEVGCRFWGELACPRPMNQGVFVIS